MQRLSRVTPPQMDDARCWNPVFMTSSMQVSNCKCRNWFVSLDSKITAVRFCDHRCLIFHSVPRDANVPKFAPLLRARQFRLEHSRTELGHRQQDVDFPTSRNASRIVQGSSPAGLPDASLPDQEQDVHLQRLALCPDREREPIRFLQTGEFTVRRLLTCHSS